VRGIPLATVFPHGFGPFSDVILQQSNRFTRPTHWRARDKNLPRPPCREAQLMREFCDRSKATCSGPPNRLRGPEIPIQFSGQCISVRSYGTEDQLRWCNMSEARKQKLQSLIYSIQTTDPFSVAWAKTQCRDCAPAYVTRVLKQLARDGHLEETVDRNESVYRWVPDKFDAVHGWIHRQVYGEQIKSGPESDRPREQLLRDGVSRLSDAQLIAILVRVGVPGESAVQAGTRLSASFSGDRLADLTDSSLAELRQMSKAIRKDSYCQIMAGIDLGRRIAVLRDINPVLPARIRGSEDAISYCMTRFARLANDGKQEEFHIVTLDTQHGPIKDHRITVGTLDASLVHPREVFRPAIRDSASAILLVHNHPSGDPTPSREDHAVTDRLAKVGELVGIRVLDHIIVSKQCGKSIMAER
jgi:DNA repair protein RadC